ncbi:MAG: hypothetical protein COY40_03325 [Alphaproteobacteria bacterium CG_4_10_14_0_8_um_filter_53_9]|nr:MAG: hypothetical protein COY40_03325 [Alphaproteobacteria bacterium CG_4_10_14_0_8_um_filter_53_9]
MSKTSQRQQAAKKEAPKPEKDITESFLKEVDDVIQQEKLANFWAQYKVFIIAGVIAILAAVAASQSWQSYQTKQIQKVATLWDQAEKAETPEEKAKGYEVVLKEGKGGYQALAAFKLAAQQTTAPAANEYYKRVYESGRQPKWIRDLARLNAAIRYLGEDDAAARSHLQLLAQHNAGEPPAASSALALEQLAWLEVRANNLQGAKIYARQLLDLPGLPADIKQRTTRILAL